MRGAVTGDGKMLLVGALGRGFSGGDLLEAAGDHDIEAAAGGAHDQGRAGGNGKRAAGGQRRGLLVGGRQDDRRLAGVERRRDPGVNANVGRRQHAVPVEGCAQPHRTLVAGGEEGRYQHHHDQRAERPGIMQSEPRVRQTGADALDRSQRALALCLPQRLRNRIPRAQRVREGGGRPMTDAGAAVEPGKRLLAARPAEATHREQDGNRHSGENDETDSAGNERQHHPEAGPGHHQEQADDGEKPCQIRPATLPRDGISGPLQGLRQLQPRQSVAIADRV
ncbi:hypothetical protein ACVW0I_007752 [Bradyrhizobium sp. LM6.11]